MGGIIMLKKCIALTFMVGFCCVDIIPVSASCLYTCDLEQQVCEKNEWINELTSALYRCQNGIPVRATARSSSRTSQCYESYNQCTSKCPRFSTTHAAATTHAATTGYRRPDAR